MEESLHPQFPSPLCKVSQGRLHAVGLVAAREIHTWDIIFADEGCPAEQIAVRFSPVKSDEHVVSRKIPRL